MTQRDTDVVVIGAGFGGLSAALHASDRRDVVLCEALNYAGGCASTFSRGGARYEAGATMFAGFAPGQWMHGWVERFELDVQITLLDPVVEFRSPDHQWVIEPRRDAFVDMLCALPEAPAAGIRSFFDELRRTADVLWSLFDAPEHLPPLSLNALFTHALRLPQYAGLLRSTLRTLGSRCRAHGVGDFQPLRLWLDAVCQITVQTDADSAEAPVAMAAVDYFFRGTAHVHGGIGVFAEAALDALRRRGADVQLATRVKRLERVGSRWQVETRKGTLQTRSVVANLLPQDVDRLRGIEPTSRLAQDVAKGWGAAMLYLRVDSSTLPDRPFHIQAVLRPDQPLVEGNLILVSVAEPDPLAPNGPRSVTVSTHVELLPPGQMPDPIAQVQQRMRDNLAANCPELRILSELPASPRTFERFTRRDRGLVGGIPRRSGLANYLQLWPVQPASGLWLTGDSTFPGQSVLAVAIGGSRVAASLP